MQTLGRHHCGFTLIEATVSIAIMAVAIAAGLQTFGSFAIGAKSWNDRSTALELANQLMAEINTLPFEDPSGSAGIGVDAGEISGSRPTYDDIDDYNGWSSSPPRNRSGAVMTEYTGYRREVEVTTNATLPADFGPLLLSGAIKRITVRVFKDDNEMARLETLRTRHNADK